MAETINHHIRRARYVLERNRTGSYTRPAPSLYPHQWNWDSGFIAIGYSHYDTPAAIKELTTLFKAQWKNGMVPQIVFDERRLGRYFPEPDFWEARRSPNAPEGGILTSGITMPPIHAYAALKVYENARRPADVVPFLKWLYPRLLESHRYFYRERDPEKCGLAYIRHPWESGMDNSPMWDKVLKKLDPKKLDIPPYKRLDLSSGVSASVRPGDEDYDRFVYLLGIFKKHDYDEAAIRKDCPFLVCGPLFNSILCASNEALAKIAGIIGEPDTEPRRWYDLTARAISERLYHASHGMFDFFDVVEDRLLDVDTAAGFMPLFSGAATKEQASKLYEYLDSASFCAMHQGNCFSIPNYDTQKEGFDRTNYWRGPIWININWMLMQGLRRYGYQQKADSVAKDILELPIRFGFREYYDSFDGIGYGSEDFSWTAALFIDTAYETYRKTGEKTIMERLRRTLWGEYVLNSGAEVSDSTAPAAVPTPVAELPQTTLRTINDIKTSFYGADGRVDYDALKQSREYAEYRQITAALRGYDLSMLKDEDEKLAFWINLYNTIVIDGIIELGIKSSVKEVIGFFGKLKYNIGGFRFSPDDIEHGVLRANSKPPMHAFRQFSPFNKKRIFSLDTIDPRIHFALVCGSRSCAPIKFYSPEKVRKELELAAINFVNSSEVIILPEEKRLLLSMIFKWYEKDFNGTDGVLEFLGRYLVDEKEVEFIKRERTNLKIEYLYYDWNLNK